VTTADPESATLTLPNESVTRVSPPSVCVEAEAAVSVRPGNWRRQVANRLLNAVAALVATSRTSSGPPSGARTVPGERISGADWAKAASGARNRM
jgi:hypothetical protein